MNKRELIGGAALCAAAGLWVGASFAGAEEARADSSTYSVNIWPQSAEMARSADYAVSVGGRPVDVLQTQVSPRWLPAGTAHPYSFATFEAEGEVTVEVSLLSTNVVWGEAKVLPAKLGARVVRTADGKARITLKAPCTAQFEPNGRHRALVLAIQPRERNAPKPGDRGVVYVGPGVHRRALTEVGSGEMLYLAPGAVLEGGVRVRGDNATVCGRGIVSGEPWAWQKGPELASGKRVGHLFDGTGRNLDIRDVILTSSWEWTLVLNAVTNALVDNVKVLCGRVLNDDGIDICRANDVVIRNTFVRAQDDCLAVKWWCDNLLMTNCTLMVDFANAVRVGYECESASFPMRNIRLCDIDILHLASKKSDPASYWGQSAFCIQASHGQTFENLLFENIRVAATEKGDNFLVARTMPINPGFRYHKGFSFDEPGHVTNLVFRNVAVSGTARPAVFIESHDARHTITDSRFENVTGCDKASVRLDISGETARQTVIAEGGRTLPDGYQGHPTTVLTREGKIICVWTLGHGGPCGSAAESADGGRTWTRIDDRFPAVYRETHKNCPTLHKCVRRDGGERLLVFSAKYRGDPNVKTNYVRLGTMISDDGGKSWREGKVADLSSAMPPTGFMQLKDGSLALFGQVRLDRMVKTDRPQDDQGVWMSVSRDDGETWSPMRIVAETKERNLCEPFCLRSPDGKTLVLLMRENRHRDCSMMCFSSDEGQTWTRPVLTAQELTGDRHEGIMLDDGRYLICFRDRMKNSPTAGQFVGWVGGWDDIVRARPGDLRIRLLNHHGRHGVWPGNEWDTGYSGVENLADGTILCTTYTKHYDDDRYSSVVATRLYPSDFKNVPRASAPVVARIKADTSWMPGSVGVSVHWTAGLPRAAVAVNAGCGYHFQYTDLADYCAGELSKRVPADRYFDFIIPAERLLQKEN